MTDPRQRFSGRVEDYARYRPGYPKAVLDLLASRCGLTSASVVADVASGTGLLAKLFLQNGNRVFGVEPNGEMRAAGERYLRGYERFTSVAGAAEATTLGTASVDFVVVGQAFHWFDPAPTRAEFARVLRPGGWVALLWNEIKNDASPFGAAYERLIRAHKTEEYKPFDVQEEVRRFLGHPSTAFFEHRQVLDLDGLKGRLLSSSYVPDAGHPGYGAMMADLEDAFRAHNRDGRVAMEYETITYYGRIG